jgi:hypothetical protein
LNPHLKQVAIFEKISENQKYIGLSALLIYFILTGIVGRKTVISQMKHHLSI